MKKFLFYLISVALSFLTISCANSTFDDIDLEMGELQNLTIEHADSTNIKFECIHYVPIADSPDESSVYAFEHLRSWNPIMLTIKFKNNILPGQELVPERIRFSNFFSNDPHSHVEDEYTGKMILKVKSEKYVVIGMENVKFSIKEGDYVFNGDLVARVDE